MLLSQIHTGHGGYNERSRQIRPKVSMLSLILNSASSSSSVLTCFIVHLPLSIKRASCAFVLNDGN